MAGMEPRIAVVTGGAQGIGGTTAGILAAAGYIVHSLDLKPNPSSAIQSHICDVTDEARQLELAAQIGPIDALLCGAGINMRPRDSRPEQIDLEAWRKTLDVNLTGTLLSVRAFRPQMRMDGAIVTMGSVAALSAMPLADGYTASKGAIVALTRCWAVDYSRFGITVNCVCPGPVDTEMMAGVREEFKESSQVQLPQHRMARPEEVGDLIAFLLSGKASYVSGAVIPVDGSLTAHSAGMPFPRRRPDGPAA